MYYFIFILMLPLDNLPISRPLLRFQYILTSRPKRKNQKLPHPMHILIKHLYIYIVIFTFKGFEVLFKSTLSDYFGYIGEIVAVVVKSVVVVGLDLLDGF